ncbi:sigma-70 family RNA polymerase sigma factor [Paenibacillus sp. FSL H8-0548]|uniref:sigma-70 family RNA polymerase sigma factor n=1 Tax=Paenibacillus sp. FSL H8-0548 TaxID=1920422 RepID=UPI0015C3EEED|nr:sigma-70 family RNA polymerase sigma factor [Paenibacillus sp. FSL H8-0548]
MNRDDLASRAIRDDEAALLERIELDKHQMYGIAYSYMRNEPDALEAIQETVCRIWIKRHTLKEPRFFTTWTIRILIRVCMDTKKKQLRERPTEDTSQQFDVTEGIEAALRLDMAAQVKLLPPKYRMVITLKYYRDMTITEIAELLEKPDGTIRTWLNKALKMLRFHMAEEEGERSYERANERGNGSSQSSASD